MSKACGSEQLRGSVQLWRWVRRVRRDVWERQLLGVLGGIFACLLVVPIPEACVVNKLANVRERAEADMRPLASEVDEA
eukprot:scaffold118539_cov31-Tisochrysis_lutea.AAC.3